MRKLYFILLALLLTYSASLVAQQTYKTNALSIQYKDVSQEAVHVNYSSSVLFAGEYLFYKVFCINKDSRWLSALSKIAYVELISETGEVVFKHKVELVEGEANSEFFIPTAIESGSYKLIAYTRWMKNYGLSSFFQADIAIINPYRNDQKVILNKNSADSVLLYTNNNDADSSHDNTMGFDLHLDKKIFESREKVVVDIKNYKGRKGYGKYTLSVRKVDTISRLLKHNRLSYKNNLFKGTSNNKIPGNRVFYEPEASGTIIKGRVIESQSKQPTKQNVAISVSGEHFLFRAKATNEEGEFTFFALDANHEYNDAVVHVIGDAKKRYEIVIEEDAPLDYKVLSFKPFTIDASLRKEITKRSIYNQLENGYYSVKPDTIKQVPSKMPFTYYEKSTTTNLDEFKRFSTIKEVFTELIKNAWTGTDTLGKPVVKVRQEDDEQETGFLPLIFIDGVFVQNHDHLLSYDARKVDNITVLRKYYIFGTQPYQGAILVETKRKDYTNQDFGAHLKNVSLFQHQKRKNYFKQLYANETQQRSSRIPDYRMQLAWEPDIELSTNELHFQFFTSDNLGQYEISLEGFTVDGKPVSLRQMIEVK